MAGNEAMLGELASALRRRDEAERLRRLATAEAALGPAPVAIEPAPRGAYPSSARTATPESATLTVPSRSSWEGMSPEERKDRRERGATRGALATAAAGGLVGGALGAPTEAIMLGGLFGGSALMGPSGLVSEGSDILAGEVYRTPATAGRFTPGPRMAAELEDSYFPDQPWTRGRGIEGQTTTPTAVEAAAERVEANRAQELATEAVLIEQRQREIEQRRLAIEQTRAREAARQRALEQRFGTTGQRAEDILALEALKMER